MIRLSTYKETNYPILKDKELVWLKGIRYQVCETLTGWYLKCLSEPWNNDTMFTQLGKDPMDWCSSKGIIPLADGIFPYMSQQDLFKAYTLLKLELGE